LRLGRTRPAGVRSSGSGTLSRNRSLAGYTIDTCESEFSEGTGDGAKRSIDGAQNGSPEKD
jgi:hypothetical protein